MIVLKGQSLFNGVIFGPISIYETPETISLHYITDTKKEILRFQTAKNSALKNLQTLYKQTVISVGKDAADIFTTHQLILEDLDFVEEIEALILEKNFSVEAAVNTTATKFSQLFREMDNPYMQTKADDISDIAKKLLSCLTKPTNPLKKMCSPIILVTKELLPSEIIQLDKNYILGFITNKGNAHSHAAILTRALNIPAIIAVDNLLSEATNSALVILDGTEGRVYINPDEKTKHTMTIKKQKLENQQKSLELLKGQKSSTKSGKEMKVLANISSLEELKAAVDNDAEGIGLFRSEFLYLGKPTYPTEEEQYQVYKKTIKTMAGKPVIIRTIDIGSDKKAPYFHLPAEENPAMGYRAIRLCLMQPDIFKLQLRAILRASVFGNTSIMFPMVNSLKEILAVKSILQDVKNDLTSDNIKFANKVKLGIMIETPAAALISDDLGQEVDFFSIGTNDLTQYTLAIDRQNQNLNYFFDPYHKAVLNLIELTVNNAHKNGISVGICGELGADKNLTSFFVNLGIDELSVSPPSILPLRKIIQNLD